MLAISFALL
jgi:hypothetical protein